MTVEQNKRVVSTFIETGWSGGRGPPSTAATLERIKEGVPTTRTNFTVPPKMASGNGPEGSR